ncbi:hypothetical protein AAMO2058_000047200 [Amorphochlora amoebiformis]
MRRFLFGLLALASTWFVFSSFLWHQFHAFHASPSAGSSDKDNNAWDIQRIHERISALEDLVRSKAFSEKANDVGSRSEGVVARETGVEGKEEDSMTEYLKDTAKHFMSSFNPLGVLRGVSKHTAKLVEGHEHDHKHHEHWHANETLRSDPCYNLFDFGLLEIWKAKEKPICKPPPSNPSSESPLTPGGIAPSRMPPSFLKCRVHTHPRLNRPTAPHTICDGSNIVFDPSKLSPAPCLKHRPNYMCEGGNSYHHFASGAFQANCQVVKGEGNQKGGLSLRNFPMDHLRDIFDSWRVTTETPQRAKISQAPVTLFVSREKGEHVNMYHTLTDWYMAWQALRVVEISPDHVQVIILDGHSEGPLDSFWNEVISRGAPMIRAKNIKSALLMHRVVWSPPGYSNILLGKKWTDCKKAMRMMEAFVADVDDGFQSVHNEDMSTLNMLYISRRPYQTDLVKRKFIGRQVDNEDALLHELESLEGVKVSKADFAHMNLKDQIHAAAASDIIVGMHGAALAHCLWMPPWGALLVDIMHTIFERLRWVRVLTLGCISKRSHCGQDYILRIGTTKNTPSGSERMILVITRQWI